MSYIGVDLGGTNIVVGVIDEEGKIIASTSRPTLRERDGQLIFDDIIEMSQSFIEKYHLTGEVGIGIGVPGSIYSKEGKIGYVNNLKLTNFEAKAYVEEQMKVRYGICCKVSLGNDADCAALGEVVAGSAKGCSDAIIITLGTGVGGGIVIDGKIFSGFYAGGGEVGHQIIVANGRQCSCGNKGCLEAYASATALIKASSEAALAHPDSLLYTMVSGDTSKMNAKIPFDAAQAGDQVAAQIIDEYITYLAIGIANTINVFKPQMILLGGGVSKQGDNLIKPLTEKVTSMVYSRVLITKIEVAKLGNDAGLIGAAMLNRK